MGGLSYITLIAASTNYLLWYLLPLRFNVTRFSVANDFGCLFTFLVDATHPGPLRHFG